MWLPLLKAARKVSRKFCSFRQKESVDVTWEPPSSEVPNRRIHTVEGTDLIQHSELFDVSERFVIPPRMLILYISLPVASDTSFEKASQNSTSFQVKHIEPTWLDFVVKVESSVVWAEDAIYSTYVFPDGSRIEVKSAHEDSMRTDGERFLWVVD